MTLAVFNRMTSQSTPQKNTASTFSHASALVAEGESLFNEGNAIQAEEVFRRALRVEPNCISALNSLAVVVFQAGNIDEAESLLQKAVEIGNAPVDVLINLAAVYCSINRKSEANHYFEIALEQKQESPDLIEKLAQVAEDLGQPEKAKNLFRKSRMMTDLPVVAYRAAFAEVDITPSGTVQLQGYFGPLRNTDYVESRLKLQAALLEDGYGNRSLFVGADIFGFNSDMVKSIRHRATEWGIAPSALVLNASHTHYGPGTVSHLVPGMGDMDEAFASSIVDQITKMLPQLYLSLAPAILSWARTSTRIGFNRRKEESGRFVMKPEPKAHYETETPIFLVTVGTRRLIMVNHGCHPTGSGAAKLIGSDYPGALRTELVEQGLADTVLFLQGAAGDIKQGSYIDSCTVWTTSPEESKAHGRRIACSVASAIAKPTPILGGINTSVNEIALPLMSEVVAQDPFNLCYNQNVNPKMVKNWLAAVTHRYAESSPNSLKMQVGVISIGEVAFVMMPSETMAITAHRIRKMCNRHDALFILGYTNGLEAYVPTDKMVEQGGYEAHAAHLVYTLPSPIDKGAEDELLKGAYLACNATAPATKQLPLPEKVVSRSSSAFFVLSTGRSGTQTLAGLFDMATNAKVWHHPKPNMIEETLHAYWGDIDRRSTFWAGRGRIICESWDSGIIHGETDHNMTPFCDLIAKDIPDSRFLILVRDPREFVRSGMRRGYYRAKGEWEVGRLRPSDDDPQLSSWLKRSQFEQVCWLWAETYRHIERIHKAIGDERVRVVRFEDLIANAEEIAAVFDFLGLEGFDSVRATEILKRKLNAQCVGDFPHPQEWNAQMNAICWSEVGEIAQKYGYSRQYQGKRDRSKRFEI